MKLKIVKAVQKLACLTFFPGEPAAREALCEMFESMIETEEQLNWLVSTLINQVGTYKGPMEIRSVFCTRFAPKDHIEAYGEYRYAEAERHEHEAILESNAYKALPAPAIWKAVRALPAAREPEPAPASPPPATYTLAELEAELAKRAAQPTLTEAQKQARLIEIAVKLNLSTLEGL